MVRVGVPYTFEIHSDDRRTWNVPCRATAAPYVRFVPPCVIPILSTMHSWLSTILMTSKAPDDVRVVAWVIFASGDFAPAPFKVTPLTFWSNMVWETRYVPGGKYTMPPDVVVLTTAMEIAFQSSLTPSPIAPKSCTLVTPELVGKNWGVICRYLFYLHCRVNCSKTHCS